MAKLSGFRKCVKWLKESGGFRKASTWTSSQSVECTDGTTVETKLSKVVDDVASHIANTSNAHNVTKEQVGLGNCDNTADADKYVKYATNADNANYATTANTANAVAWDNVSGKPSTYNPSSHNHDDRYYTETDINNILSDYSRAKFSYDASTGTLTITN